MIADIEKHLHAGHIQCAGHSGKRITPLCVIRSGGLARIFELIMENAMARGWARLATLVMGYGLAGSTSQAQGDYHGYEAPPYVVEAQVGPAELRAYGAYLVAEVTVSGAQDRALGRGFQVLAGYIFGANAAQGQVEMTVPVAQRPAQTIAMTTPVAQAGAGDSWTVSFMMPGEWTLDTLPVPRNDEIRFVPVAPERQIVLRFSGRATTAALASRTAELRALAEGAGLDLTAGPFFYFYDDPFTLPWNRRNEVAFTLR